MLSLLFLRLFYEIISVSPLNLFTVWKKWWATISA